MNRRLRTDPGCRARRPARWARRPPSGERTRDRTGEAAIPALATPAIAHSEGFFFEQGENLKTHLHFFEDAFKNTFTF